MIEIINVKLFGIEETQMSCLNGYCIEYTSGKNGLFFTLICNKL